MTIAYQMSLLIGKEVMLAPAVFAFGLVAFGFLNKARDDCDSTVRSPTTLIGL